MRIKWNSLDSVACIELCNCFLKSCENYRIGIKGAATAAAASVGFNQNRFTSD